MENIINYNISVHEKEIVSFFGEDNMHFNEKNFSDLNRKILFVCFTNRCGSNVVCEHLGKSKKFNIGGENLNHDAVINNSKRLNFTSFSEYFDWLLNVQSGKKEYFVVKTSWQQLYFLKKYGYLNDQFDKLDFLVLKRKDILSQAISYSVALQNGAWTSLQSKKDVEIKYDRKTILAFLKGVLESYPKFEYLFYIKQWSFLQMIYEDYCSNPKVKIESLIEKITGEKENILASEMLQFRKQVNPDKQRIREVFLKDMKSV